MTILITINILFSIFIIILELDNLEELLKWILVIWILPVVGLASYIFLGFKNQNRYTYIKRNRKFNLEFIKLMKEWKDDFELGLNKNINYKEINNLVISKKNECTVFTSDREKDIELFKDIRKSKRSIHVEYDYMNNDILGGKFLRILENSAKNGIEVRLIYREVDSFKSKNNIYKNLKALGGEVKINKGKVILKRFQSFRNLIIIDGEIGYIFGKNLLKEDLILNEGKGNFRDIHLKFKGGSVNILQYYFIKDWIHFNKKGKLDIDISLIKKYFRGNSVSKHLDIQIISNGEENLRHKKECTCHKIISSARNSIIVEIPYVILSPTLFKELLSACLSGIEVKFIIQKKRGGKLNKTLGNYYIEKLAKCGAKFYEYQGYINSKSIVIDDKTTGIGFINLPINNQFNAVFYDSEFTKKYIEGILKDLENSIELNY